jgi:hypothetical protein
MKKLTEAELLQSPLIELVKIILKLQEENESLKAELARAKKARLSQR